MSPVRAQSWIDPLAPFEIMLKQPQPRKAVVLRTARDADRATMAYLEEWQRLTRDHAAGDLLLVHHDEEPRTLLWEPLGEARPDTGETRH